VKTFARVFGWLLILAGVVSIGVVIYLAVTDAMPGGFTRALLLSAPGLLAITVGGILTRVGRKEESAHFAEADSEWTRRRLKS
jgi:hypothetical protein